MEEVKEINMTPENITSAWNALRQRAVDTLDYQNLVSCVMGVTCYELSCPINPIDPEDLLRTVTKLFNRSAKPQLTRKVEVDFTLGERMEVKCVNKVLASDADLQG